MSGPGARGEQQDKDFAEVRTWPGKTLEDSVKEVLEHWQRLRSAGADRRS
ncbi:hypothetical protein AB0F65_17735 [Nocardia rhamnosiphila]|uniref:Uncharacterized protein n=1 Tax=Nocardia rhamnosiphila TaxID=426716 RepID=A0ABV2WZH7_9NOCA